MTQIRSMAQPVPRRPGELGVHSLDHFNFVVPDVAQAEKFYGLFGLDTKEEDGKLALYTHGHPHRWGVVSEGPRKKFTYVSFGAFEDDLPRFRERLEKLRIDRLDPPKGFESNGLWFRDPDGTLVEIRVAEKSSPNAEGDLRDEGRRRRPPERAEPQQGAHGAAAAARPCSAFSSPTSRGPSTSTATCWACGCRTAPAISSPSCTASTAATTT